MNNTENKIPYNLHHNPLYSFSVTTNFGVYFSTLLSYACKIVGWAWQVDKETDVSLEEILLFNKMGYLHIVLNSLFTS